jgi:hypothetical protein
MQGVYFAKPSLRQCLDVDRTNPWILTREAVDELAGAVGGTIIDQNNLQFGVILLQERSDG